MVPIHGCTMLDINATVNLHQDISPNLSAANGLTGCDTVAPYFYTGNTVARPLITSSYPELHWCYKLHSV